MEIIIHESVVQWDEQKNRLNLHKHHIDFEDAALVFADPERVEIYDDLHSSDEDRYIAIGRVYDVLFVVYTERGEKIRLISARKATEREKKLYYAND